MKNKLIAFTGKAQAGKTESSKILEELVIRDGYKFVKISFASALKDIAKLYFGWDGDKGIYYVDGEPVKDRGRQLLINIGAKFREIRPTIWADIALEEMKRISEETPEGIVFCIDDLRFKNEVAIVNKFGASKIIKIVRPNGQLSIDDISEKDLDDVKFETVVENSGTLEDLAKSVEKVYNLAITGN
jgi:hypothetical protein